MDRRMAIVSPVQDATRARRVIENRHTGERIVVRQSGAETDGGLLSFELFLEPGGKVPSSHAHPEQEERFTVIAGRMRFRVDGRTLVVGAGGSVTVPPRTVHGFTNLGASQAQVLVEVRPALRMQELLEAAAALGGQDWILPGLPRPLDLALMLREFEREIRAPVLPAAVRLATWPLAWLARRGRPGRRYRSRCADGPPAAGGAAGRRS